MRLMRALGILAIGLVIVAAAGWCPMFAAVPQPKYGTVSFEAVGADAANVLQMMAKMAKLSLVADGTVTGKMTISLKGVLFNDAMDVVCRTRGWAWSRIGDTILVGDPAAVKGKDVSPGQQRMEVVPLWYAEPTEAASKLSLALKAEQVRVDARTNSIIVLGSEAEIALARSILKAVDIPIPQVAVVARVEEISKNAMRDLGVNWDLGGPISIGIKAGKIEVGVGYSAALKAMEEKGEARALAKPAITTLDGQEASILLGDKIPISRDVIQADGKVAKTIEFIDVGVKLKILPRVNGPGRVTIRISPEISSVTGMSAEGYPTISTREANTIVTVNNGETIAIGGLFQRQEIETIKRLPIIGSLPFIGQLFSSTRKTMKDSELVVLITPYITTPEVPADLRPKLAEPAWDQRAPAPTPRSVATAPAPVVVVPLVGPPRAGVPRSLQEQPVYAVA